MATTEQRMTVFAALLLVGAAPLLSFPQLVPPPMREVIVAAGTIAACAVAVALLLTTSRIGWIVGVLAIAVACGWWRAGGSDVSLSHFGSVGVGLLAMAVVSCWCRSEMRLTVIAMLVLAGGAAIVALGLVATATPYPKLIRPDELTLSLPHPKLGLPGLPANGFVDSNALGGTALMIAPLAAALVCSPRRTGSCLWPWVNVVALAAACVTAFVIYATQSRSVWLSAWATLFAFSVRVGTNWKGRGVALGVLAVVSTAIITGLWWSSRDAYARAIDPDAADRLTQTRHSADYRIDIMKQGVEQLKRSPLFGIGLNRFRQTYVPPADNPQVDVAHAHNILLQTALDAGLIGAAAYLGLMCVLLACADKAAHGPVVAAAYVSAGAGLSLLAAQAFGLGDAIPLGAKVGIFQWLAAGLIVAGWRMQHAAQQEGARWS